MEKTKELFQTHLSSLEEREAGLERLLTKGFSDSIKISYALNEVGEDNTLRMVEISFSIEQLLASIVESDFQIDAFSEEGGIVKKRSDLFSTPFSWLSTDYSMGALPYPENPSVRLPLAIVEVRSYPDIFESMSCTAIQSFVTAEVKYIKTIKQIFKTGLLKNFKAAEEKNLKSLCAAAPRVPGITMEKSSSIKIRFPMDKIDGLYTP